MDGADRGREAAAHPGRRDADDGLRLHRGHRARQPARGGVDATDEVFNIGSGTETSLLELAAALLRSWERTASRVRPAARRELGHAAACRCLAGREAPRLAGRGRPRGRPAAAGRLVAGGARPRPQRRGAAHDDPGDAAVARRGGGGGSGGGRGLRLGRPRAAGRRVRAGIRRAIGVDTRWRCRHARRACTWRCSRLASARATRSSSRRYPLSPPPMPSGTSARVQSSPMSTPRRSI